MSETEHLPKGFRIWTRDELRLHPLPPGALCSLFPFTMWLASGRVGEIIGNTVHAYAVPINQPEMIDSAAIAALLPETFYADRPILERLQFMVDGWRRAIEGLCKAEEDIDNLLKQQKQITE